MPGILKARPSRAQRILAVAVGWRSAGMRAHSNNTMDPIGLLNVVTTGGVLHFPSNDGSRSDAHQSRNHVYREVTDACVPARNKELSDLKSRAQRGCRDAQQQFTSAITKCKRQSVQQKNCGMLDVVRNVRNRPRTWWDYC
jgi:hypothetical protein